MFSGQEVQFGLTRASSHLSPIERSGSMVLVFTYRFERRVGHVSGRVQDQDGNPISGAKLSVSGSVTHSDASGHFELIIPGDKLAQEWICRPLRMEQKRKHIRSFPTPTSSRLLYQLLRNGHVPFRAFIILAMVVVVSKIQASAVVRGGWFCSNELGGPPIGNIEVSALVGNTNNTMTAESLRSLFRIRTR